MKKTILSLVGASAVIGTLFVTSCQKDTLTKAGALNLQESLSEQNLRVQDSLQKAGGIIRYSVTVIAANQTSFSGKKSSVQKVQGLQGATVALDQNGVIVTATTDVNGIALFPNSRIGTATAVVTLAGFTTVDFKTDLTPTEYTNGNVTSSTVRQVSTMVPIFATTGAANLATITGNATIETNLTNTTRELVPAGTVVSAYINAADGNFIDTYLNGNNTGPGTILSASYETALTTATVTATGTYVLNVPAAVNQLPIAVAYSDVVTTQTLIGEYFSGSMFTPTTVAAILTVRTTFTQNTAGVPGGYNSIPNDGSIAVTVSAPPAQGTGATATALLQAQSLQGQFGNLTTFGSTGGLTPGVYNVIVTNAATSFDGSILTPSVAVPASISILVNGAGNVAGITGVPNYGYGYRQAPTLSTTYAGPGSLVVSINNWTSPIASVGGPSNTVGTLGSTITSGGSGYVVAPNVYYQINASSNPQSFGSGLATISAGGVVTNIPTGGSFSTPPTLLFTPQNVVNAAFTASNNSNGTISLNLNNGGSGYNPASLPTITITSLIAVQPTVIATATPVVSTGGVITGFFITNYGAGYSTCTNGNYPTGFKAFAGPPSIANSSTTFNVSPGNTYAADVYYGTGYHSLNVN